MLKTLPEFDGISVGKHMIKRERSFKLLGVTLDENLNWHQHISNVQKNCRFGILLLKKLKRYFSVAQLISFFHAFIQSHITYGVTSWGMTYNTALLPIMRIQKRAIRVIGNMAYNDSTQIFFSTHK